jgi:hypothetical protein
MNKISEKQTKPAIERIKSISRVLAVLCKIARIFCFVGIGVLGCGILFLMIFGDMDLIVLGGNVVVHSPYALVDMPNVSHWQLVFMSFAGVASFILLAILFKRSREIFHDISVDESPFTMKQVKRIRKIAILFLIISVLNFEGFTPAFSVNFAGVLGALMFWCISLIFEYGCELQKQSDETL